MKTLIQLITILIFGFTASAQELINLGTTANDGTGDKLRAAGIKINTNAFNFDRRLDNIEGQTNQFGTGGSGITNVGSALLSASNYYARVVQLTTNDNIVSTISNVSATADTLIKLAPGTYTLTPSVVTSNGLGAINLFNKSGRVRIEGDPGLTILDGTSALGEVLWVTNCANFSISGVTIRGRVETNTTAVGPWGVNWASFSYWKTPGIVIENCFFDGGHTHGVLDFASQVGRSPESYAIIRFNRFYNFGSWISNNIPNIDGTAIVPISGEVYGNLITESLRGIEPYASGIAPRVSSDMLHIHHNRILNTLDAAITFAGNTNVDGVIIEHNVMVNTNGYSRRGSNTLTTSTGIILNGGHRHIVRNNEVSGFDYIGIEATQPANPTIGLQIINNTISGISNQYTSGQSYGIFLGDSANTVVFSAKKATVRGNNIRRIRHDAIRVLGAADSVIENNVLDDPAFPGSTAGIFVQSATSISSNIIVRNNFIRDLTGNMNYGITLSAGVLGSKLENNDVQGFNTAAVNNLAGPAAVAEYNTTSASTNRLLRAHEVRTQIEAGSNITLTTNSSGVVTITGAAGGSSGTNFAGIIVTNLADIKGHVTITSNLTVSGAIIQIGNSAEPGVTSFYETNGTKYSQIRSPEVIQTNNVLILPTNATAGVMIAQPAGTGTNQIHMVQLGVGQYATFNGTSIVASNVPAVYTLPSYVLTNNQATSVALLGDLAVTDEVASGDLRVSANAGINTLAITNSIIYTPVAKTGVGGANTNFTLLSTQPEVYINGFTNVSIRAVMGYDPATVAYWTCVITNGSGSDRTIEFSAVTNRYRFTGTYGTNAPVTITNNTTLEISGRQVGTNVFVAYGYFAWP